MDAGKFRQDLYYRLNVFPVVAAPLRQRKEDIPALTEKFVEDICRRMNRTPLRLTKKAIDTLGRYDWPGNIRELQNVVERAIITSTGSLLAIELPVASKSGTGKTSSPEIESSRILTDSEVRKLERDNILRALGETGGRISGSNGAAKLLGIKPSTLSSRIKAMKIRWIAQ